MDFVIRPATDGDYEAICALCELVDRLHFESLPDIFRTFEGPARRREYIQTLIADQNSGLFVAEANGQLVGYVNAALVGAAVIPLLRPRRYEFVDNLVVAVGYETPSPSMRLAALRPISTAKFVPRSHG